MKRQNLLERKGKPTKQHKRETNSINRLLSDFISKTIYLLNFHEVENGDFEQPEKPIYEHIGKHQVHGLYQAN